MEVNGEAKVTDVTSEDLGVCAFEAAIAVMNLDKAIEYGCAKASGLKQQILKLFGSEKINNKISCYKANNPNIYYVTVERDTDRIRSLSRAKSQFYDSNTKSYIRNVDPIIKIVNAIEKVISEEKEKQSDSCCLLL
jgi:hypothetical protein